MSRDWCVTLFSWSRAACWFCVDSVCAKPQAVSLVTPILFSWDVKPFDGTRKDLDCPSN